MTATEQVSEGSISSFSTAAMLLDAFLARRAVRIVCAWPNPECAALH
jgi:hypothetical protein